MELLHDEPRLQELYNTINQYNYGFENLAFEGGGAKLSAYVGAVQVLHSLGITEKCTRFSGTSGGGLLATVLACRMSMEDIAALLESIDMDNTIKDSSFGVLSLLPNIVGDYGWNPGKRFLDQWESVLEKATGNRHITFIQVYKKFGTELCVVGTNITSMSVEYFHPKTTPNLEVAKALRITVCLPGYLAPVRILDATTNMEQFYLDGGLVCNYPVHVFDGWYLSMKFEDSFFHKLGTDEPLFGKFEPKTLGLLLYASEENDYMEGSYRGRCCDSAIKRPDTKLAKERGQQCDEALIRSKEKTDIMEAGQRFLQGLRQVDSNKDALISMEEFKQACEDKSLKENDCEILFGKDFSVEKAFEELDRETDGQVTIEEFLLFMQRKGLRFRHLLEGGNMANITSFGDFVNVTLSTVLNTTPKVYFKTQDPDRTLGIYTDYIDTSDFKLEDADKTFARQ